MLPVALTLDRAGDVLVADFAGQRIRRIHNGIVSTVAGGGDLEKDGLAVKGGYRDGPVASARFRHPAGVAVDAAGAMYVADAGNHCIRKIASGSVSTFAGSPDVAGKADGPKASFTDPHGLAFDASGNLYVADNGVGVRKIASDGSVLTLAMPINAGTTFLSVRISETADGKTLYVAGAGGIIFYDLQTGTSRLAQRTTEGGNREVNAADTVPLGPLAALYSDPLRHAIDYLRVSEPPGITYDASRPIVGADFMSEDAGAGHVDATSNETARLREPLGLARYGSDGLLIADAGNRVIRLARLPDLRRASGLAAAPVLPKSLYRVAFVGNSYAYWNTVWPESTPGLIETELNNRRQALGVPLPVRVVANRFDGASLSAIASFIDDVLASESYDLVIWSVNSFEVSIEQQEHPDVVGPAAIKARLGTVVAQANRAMQKSGGRLVVVAQPLGVMYAPHEVTSFKMRVPLYEDLFEFQSQIESDLGQSGVPVIRTIPAYLEYERAAHGVPLYEPGDNHPTRAGNRFFAELIIAGLKTIKPWPQPVPRPRSESK